MKKTTILSAAVLLLLALNPMQGTADIAVKSGNLALFLKPAWTRSEATAGHWDFDATHEWYVPGEKGSNYGGRKFYQYEDSAGDGVLFTVKASAKGLPEGYRHKGTAVVAEIGWSKRSPVTAQEVWEIWEGLPDNSKYKKAGVTQIQMLSDDMLGTCYALDNKYGNRDLRILLYGAELTGDTEQDKALIEKQMLTALSGECLCTKGR